MAAGWLSMAAPALAGVAVSFDSPAGESPLSTVGFVDKELIARQNAEKEERARLQREGEARAAGARIDWARDAVYIPGTDTAPLEDWKACEGMEENRGKPGFCMGTTDRGINAYPVHKVQVPSFRMLKSAVTVAQYRACVKARKCSEPDPRSSYDYCNWTIEPGDREEHPVNCVSHDQAQAFAQFAGGRLPSEAEREFAATSRGMNRKYPWGNEEPSCDRVVMNSGGLGCGNGGTMPVCSKPRGNTAQGLCDMAGNLWEWTQDTWHDSYEGAPTDGRAWEDSGWLRVVRGGSFLIDFSRHLRSDFRSFSIPHVRFLEVGFRLVR